MPAGKCTDEERDLWASAEGDLIRSLPYAGSATSLPASPSLCVFWWGEGLKVIPHGKYTARLSVGGQGSTNTPHKSRRHRTSETQNQVDLTSVQKKIIGKDKTIGIVKRLLVARNPADF